MQFSACRTQYLANINFRTNSQVTTSAANIPNDCKPCLKDGLAFFLKMGYKPGQTCQSVISESPFSSEEIHISKCVEVIDKFQPLLTAVSELLLATEFLEEYLLIALSLVSLAIILTTTVLYYIRQCKNQLMTYLHDLETPVQQRYAPVISHPIDQQFELPARDYLQTPYIPSCSSPVVVPGPSLHRTVIASAPTFNAQRPSKRDSYHSRL